MQCKIESSGLTVLCSKCGVLVLNDASKLSQSRVTALLGFFWVYSFLNPLRRITGTGEAADWSAACITCIGDTSNAVSEHNSHRPIRTVSCRTKKLSHMLKYGTDVYVC